MNVLHILDHSLPAMSGYSTRSRNIITFQRSLGLRPVVLTSPKHPLPGPDCEMLEGIPHYRTPQGPARAWFPYVGELALMVRLARRIREVARAEFEGWIAPELALIQRAIDAALADAGLGAEGVDRVFLTGGSSLVPAVRRLFAQRFDAGRIETGAELESIASGLALMGRERDLTRWTEQA